MNTFFIIFYTIIILGCSVVCVVLGRHISQGKGDSLIAGYNSMSEEKQAEYDIVRLRRVTSWMAYTMAAILPLFCLAAFLPAQYAIATNIILTVITIIIAVTATTKGDQWAKKDKKESK